MSAPIPTVAATRWPDRPLLCALLATAALASVLAWCQRGYLNADFVAYATVAHRVVDDPAGSVTGYWAPLFSWLMAPLVWLGVDDLVAGRAVLVLGALGYVAAVDGVVRRLASSLGERAGFVRCGMLANAAVQGSLWSNYLLDPDLLGSTFAYVAVLLLAGADTAVRPGRSVAIGLAMAMAFFGKSFQLPFLLVMVPVLRWLLPRLDRPQPLWRIDADGARRWLASLGCTALGLALVAGPWIAAVSLRYGRFTVSTAGPANHANVGPGVRGLDRLWTPPLEADYILSPHLEPDWSPLASLAAFAHQLYLLGANSLHAASLLAGPLLLLVATALVRRRRRLPPLALGERRLALTMVLLAAVFVGGYAMIQVGRRYLLPTVAPALLFAGMLFASTLVARARPPRRAALQAVAIALLFTAQELRLLYVTAVRHPQSTRIADGRGLAGELRAQGLAELPFASNRWHEGLLVGYGMGAVACFLGTPWDGDAAQRAQAIEAAGAQVFLRFVGGDAPPAEPPPAGWTLAFRSPTARIDRAQCEVYRRAR